MSGSFTIKGYINREKKKGTQNLQNIWHICTGNTNKNTSEVFRLMLQYCIEIHNSIEI